jgi:hypothetical protein
MTLFFWACEECWRGYGPATIRDAHSPAKNDPFVIVFMFTLLVLVMYIKHKIDQ